MPRRADREIRDRPARVGRDRTHVAPVAADVLGEVSAHGEPCRVRVRRVEALVVFNVSFHGVDEGEIVPGRGHVVAVAADALASVLDVPGVFERTRSPFAIREREPDPLAVGERRVLRDVVHFLAAHRVAVEDEDERDRCARVERGR